MPPYDLCLAKLERLGVMDFPRFTLHLYKFQIVQTLTESLKSKNHLFENETQCEDIYKYNLKSSIFHLTSLDMNLKHAIYTEPVINRNHAHSVSDGKLRRLQVLNRFILKIKKIK